MFKRIENIDKKQSIWLRLCVDAFLAGREAFPRETLRVAFFKETDYYYDGIAIDDRLLKYTSEPTILGLWHIFPDHPLIACADNVLKVMRGIVLDEPAKSEISAAEILEKIKGNSTVQEVCLSLALINNFQLLFSGGSRNQQFKSGFSGVTIDPNRGLQLLLEYKDLPALTEISYNYFNQIKERHSPKELSDSETKEVKNTAFILMQIDDTKPELEDVYNALKEVCRRFKIDAVRADEIEHQERITDKIIESIESSQYLLADLSGERPNVYYEVGFAHALHKNPILFRKKGTRLHFDLSIHNVPEYENATELKEILHNRFEAILGKKVRRP